MWNNYGNYCQLLNFSYQYPTQEYYQSMNMYPLVFAADQLNLSLAGNQLFSDPKQ